MLKNIPKIKLQCDSKSSAFFPFHYEVNCYSISFWINIEERHRYRLYVTSEQIVKKRGRKSSVKSNDENSTRSFLNCFMLVFDGFCVNQRFVIRIAVVIENEFEVFKVFRFFRIIFFLTEVCQFWLVAQSHVDIHSGCMMNVFLFMWEKISKVILC